MDVKHFYDINMGFKFNNFPSFEHILCMYKTESDISSKITNRVQRYFVTVLFDYNDPVPALCTQHICTEQEIIGCYYGWVSTVFD